jgi:hypothetical protein
MKPRCADMREALACRAPTAVPVWELEFHLWNAFDRGRLTLGRAFADLTAAEQERALHANAETIVAVAGELGFSAVTAPGGYWEYAPGHPAYYWLPNPARDEQIRILAKLAVGQFLIAAGSGGVIGMPGAADYVEFSYRLFDVLLRLPPNSALRFSSALPTLPIGTASSSIPGRWIGSFSLSARMGGGGADSGRMVGVAQRWQSERLRRCTGGQRTACPAGHRSGGRHGHAERQAPGGGPALPVRQHGLRPAAHGQPRSRASGGGDAACRVRARRGTGAWRIQCRPAGSATAKLSSHARGHSGIQRSEPTVRKSDLTPGGRRVSPGRDEHGESSPSRGS